jgi:hypothetical protein
MQACNLELVHIVLTQTIEGVEELFPSLLLSKEISREQIEGILKDVINAKN